MEEQIVELAAKLAVVESKANVTNSMFAEAFYYVTIPLMILIHAGFLAYEMGASRTKNVLTSGVKNILAFPLLSRLSISLGGGSIGASPRVLPCRKARLVSPALPMPTPLLGVGARAPSTWDQILLTKRLVLSLGLLPCLPQQRHQLCPVQ